MKATVSRATQALVGVCFIVALGACSHHSSTGPKGGFGIVSGTKSAEVIKVGAVGEDAVSSDGTCGSQVVSDANDVKASCNNGPADCDDALESFKNKYPSLRCTFSSDGETININTDT